MTYRGNVWRYYAFQGLVDIMLWIPIWIIYLQEHRFSLAMIGVLGAWELMVMTLSEVPSGALADRFGRSRTLALGASMIAVGGVMYVVGAELHSFAILMVAEIPAMAGATFLTGTNEAMLYDSLKADGQEDRFNRVNSHAMTLVQAAQAVGSVAGGFLFAVVAQWSPFIVTALLAFGAAAVALTLKEPPRSKRLQGSGLSYREILTGAFRTVTVRPVVRYVVICRALLNIAPFIAVFILLQPYAREVEVPLAFFGIMFMVVRGASMAGIQIGGRLNPARVLRWLVLCQVAALAGLLVAAYVGAWPGVIAILLVALAGGVQAPLLATMLNRNIASETRATVISVQSLVTTILMMLTQPAAGAISDLWGYSTGFVFLAAFPFVALVPVVLLAKVLRMTRFTG